MTRLSGALGRHGLGALWVALSLGCSGGWLNAPAEISNDEPANAAEPPAATPSANASAMSCTVEAELAATMAPEEAVPAPVNGFPLRPLLTADLHRLRRAAQQRVLGGDCPPGPHALAYAPFEGTADTMPEAIASAAGETGEEECVSPPALGHFVPVENEPALEHFHQALARLAAGEDEDGKVRILAYGASHTQADLYTGYLRAYLQSRFGNGGQGFVLLGRVNRWHRTLDTRARHLHLKVHHARYKKDVEAEPLGLFGAALLGRTGDAFGEVVISEDSQNTQFEVHYFKQPNGGDFTLSVDGKTIARIATSSERPEAGYYSFEASPGGHTIHARLRGNGPVRLFGIVAETAGPGVVVDTLGIGGARITDSLRWDEDSWFEAVRHRNLDLVTFAYGTNESMDTPFSAAAYQRGVRAVLTRLRKAAPEVSCAFISPFDLSKRENGRWKTRAALLAAIDTQRRISKEFGCSFWDGYAFMGGAGSIHRWASAKPPLASTDRIHLTRLGYVYAGVAIGDALMRAYDLNANHWSSSAAAAAPSGPLL